MVVSEYIEILNQRYALGNTTEHTFRGDLQQLLESLLPDLHITNEPKRQACGAPDYILTKNEIPVGFIEAKDIGEKDLEGTKKTGNKAQFDRYKAALNNIIFTDYIKFYLYQEGELVAQIAIAELNGKKIEPIKENFKAFENLIKSFYYHVGQTINSSKKLAQMMAAKARLLSDIIGKALISDETSGEDSTLKDQMLAFRQILIHDITPQAFADVYAQTIAYGMFAARLHDAHLDSFSRQKAAQLIPKSNPFLRNLFQYVAGYDLDDRIIWVVDDLADIFLACNIEEILKNYGKSTNMEDPIIHFYETFLSEYDPKLRKSRGVWYTPQPVVDFMVRALDEILQVEFGLENGLANASKMEVVQKEKQNKEEIHKVQILDPATGTGTFLAEIIKNIHKKFKGKEGIWDSYVENDLLPRLHGFELLMASYAMAHLKLDLLLSETGYQPTKNQRLRIFLTNSLEESQPEVSSLFASWLSREANEANQIKRDTPLMCVIGNPPYAVSSSNKNEWIQNLIADYKKDLNEKNIQPLSDDYIKFIRYGQHFIHKNGSGILAYVSNNSFIDGVIHRQMRKNLLQDFDKIYILDLHGNAKKKEVAPDGSPDQNVFDIMQGVSINIFVKTGKKAAEDLGKVFYYELFGKRKSKYEVLTKNKMSSLAWKQVEAAHPNYFFVEKNFQNNASYQEGFALQELFGIYASGIKTHDDNKLVSNKKFDENNQLYYYRPFDVRYINYDLNKVERHRFSVMKHLLDENIAILLPRQAITEKFGFFLSKGLTDGNYTGVAGQFGAGLVFPLYLYPESAQERLRGQKRRLDELELLELRQEELLALIDNAEKSFANLHKLYKNVENPDQEMQNLYQHQAKNLQKLKNELSTLKEKWQRYRQSQQADVRPTQLFEQKKRVPNLNPKIIQKIEKSLDLIFIDEKENKTNTFSPIDILDYIYAILHAPTYREKYKEFLKIDFPRIPYPKDADSFWQLVWLGEELRQVHLLESEKINNATVLYPKKGNNKVEKFFFQNEKIYINESQFFDNVPAFVWDFYIGGYQPAQKWLKDRKDEELSLEDIAHYQKIIVAIQETKKLMQEIDKIYVK
ncbi:type ISP restriction/modification enzyme [Hugenholtzia roseola]|uniref:type ISP restriction/modification enzyme n=1 Tax=Hugenholtzia roseola TaxID=1002 RepID=UPI00040D9A0E|nr:type ISP restriction/modification enzyme [Hugenholtzia roseola]